MVRANSILILAALSSTSVTACTSDLDCSLLGECTSQGVCRCDAGWKGIDCGVADLKPWNYTGYLEGTSWGGKPVKAKDGTWHLYFSYLNGCPLGYFSNTSSIQHAVSDSVVGNFTIVDEAIVPFAHNPSTQQAPDGSLVMYYIGRDPPVHVVPTCNRSDPASSSLLSDHSNQKKGQQDQEAVQIGQDTGPFQPTTYIHMATSPSFEGPWNTSVNPLPMALNGASNPAVWIHPNGSSVMVYRCEPVKGDGESLAVATADHWKGPFTPRAGPFITSLNGSGANEDPFLFYNKRGYHVVTHNQGLGTVCKNETGNYCGGHLYSEDLVHWTASQTPMYDGKLPTIDGQVLAFSQRQRPQLVFDDTTGKPLALFTGGSFDPHAIWTQAYTHTIAMAFNT